MLSTAAVIKLRRVLLTLIRELMPGIVPGIYNIRISFFFFSTKIDHFFGIFSQIAADISRPVGVFCFFQKWAGDHFSYIPNLRYTLGFGVFSSNCRFQTINVLWNLWLTWKTPGSEYHISLKKCPCSNKHTPALSDNPNPSFDGMDPMNGQNQTKTSENRQKTGAVIGCDGCTWPDCI